MLQLLQEGVGVVYVQQDRAVGFVVLEVEILLAPFLLNGEELLFQLKLQLGTVDDLLDGSHMATWRRGREGCRRGGRG